MLAQVCVPKGSVSPNKQKGWHLEQRKIHCRAVQGDRWLTLPSKYPEIPEGFQQGTFKSQMREEGLRGWDELMHCSLIG